MKCMPTVLLAALTLCSCQEGTLPATVPPPDPALGQHWLRFVHLSDTQLVDEESPARTLRLDDLIQASWRGQEAYGVPTLDATVREINRIHAAGKQQGAPIDFLIATGDLADLAGYNELRWFIDTLDGKRIELDTGDIDGLTRTERDEDNPKLAYQTEGLAQDLPWYTVVGNHDILAVGNFPIETSLGFPELYTAPVLGIIADWIGLHDIQEGYNALTPGAGRSPAVLTGEGPLLRDNGAQIDVDRLRAGEIPRDLGRRFVTLPEFIREHFNSSSLPEGHGFTQENIDSGSAAYTFRPREDIPLRVIVLNTVPPVIPRSYPAFYGVLTREQFESFLKPELEKARLAEEFVIVASHHPPADFDLPFPASRVATAEFRDYLATQPHLVAHICGHSHINRAREVLGAYPYLEIETGAIIDFPQEFRVIDLYWNESEQSLTVASTLASHMNEPTRLSFESYRRSELELLSFRAPLGKSDEAAYQRLFQEFQPLMKALGGDSIPREHVPTRAERAGQPGDRNFVYTLPR